MKALACMSSKMFSWSNRVVTSEQRSEEWYKEREQLITASEAAAALGFSTFETQDQFMKRKKSRIRQTEINEDMHRGTVLEPIAREELRTIFSEVWDEGLVKHPRIPCIAASPDAIVSRMNAIQNSDNVHDSIPYRVNMCRSDRSHIINLLPSSVSHSIVEIKCPRKFKRYTDSQWTVNVGHNMYVPISYWVQMQVQMACLDVELSYFMNCHFTYYREPMSQYDDSDLTTIQEISTCRYPIGVMLNMPFNSEMCAITWSFIEYDIYPVTRDDRWLDDNIPKMCEIHSVINS